MNLELELTNPESAHADLQLQASALAQSIDRTPIADLDALLKAKHDRVRLGDAMDQIRAKFEPLKAMANRLHKAICQRERVVMGPLQTIDAERREAIAEFTRQESERRRQAEREAEDQQRRQRESVALHEAAALEAAGYQASAAAVLEDALIPAPALSVTQPDAVAAIVSSTRYWRWRYAGGSNDRDQTAPDTLRRALALVPREFLIVDEKKLNTYARAMKDTAAVPGIEFYYVDLPNR